MTNRLAAWIGLLSAPLVKTNLADVRIYRAEVQALAEASRQGPVAISCGIGSNWPLL